MIEAIGHPDAHRIASDGGLVGFFCMDAQQQIDRIGQAEVWDTVSQCPEQVCHPPGEVRAIVAQNRPSLERFHDRLHDLELALQTGDTESAYREEERKSLLRSAPLLQTGDTESAYRAARSLRTAMDVLCCDLLQTWLAEPTDELLVLTNNAGADQFTERSVNLSPLDQARVDLAKCIAARDAKRGAR